MKKNAGFTLVEMAIAAALGTLVTVWGFQLMSSLVNSQVRVQETASVKGDLTTASHALWQRVGNVALITPPEGLGAAADAAYPGVASPGAAIPVSGCQHEAIDGQNERFSIIRFTSFDNLLSPEITLRQWRDSDHASDDLEITYHAPVDGVTERIPYVFQVPEFAAQEVLLVDGDGIGMRRFRVLSYQTHLGVNLDPADGLPKVDAGGNPILFNYRTVRLGPVMTLSGNTVPMLNQNFVSGSILYSVKTSIACVSTSGKLILKDVMAGTEKVLLDPAAHGATLDLFEARYYGTRPTASHERLELSLFHLFPLADSTQRNCLNNVLLRMRMTFLDPRKTPQLVEELVRLASFEDRRPAGCQ